jgi:hypothetical protein
LPFLFDQFCQLAHIGFFAKRNIQCLLSIIFLFF